MREHETELFSSSRIFGGNNRTVRLSRRFFSKLHADMVWGCLPSHINDLSIGKKTENEGQNNTGDCRCDKYDHVWWSVSREKCNAYANHRQSNKNWLENAFLNVIVLRHRMFHNGASFPVSYDRDRWWPKQESPQHRDCLRKRCPLGRSSSW